MKTKQNKKNHIFILKNHLPNKLGIQVPSVKSSRAAGRLHRAQPGGGGGSWWIYPKAKGRASCVDAGCTGQTAAPC